MKCKKCGNELENDIKYCGKCGQKVNKPEKPYIKIKFTNLIIIIGILVIIAGFVIVKIVSSQNSLIQKAENIVNTETNENIIRIKEKDWYNKKSEQEPNSYNIARKEFYIDRNTVIGLISIAYSEGNVFDIKFTGIVPDEIFKNCDTNTILGYSGLVFSIPQLLKYETEDEELSKYLQDILIKSWDNNDWYLNEIRQGIKFSIGGDKNNYLNIECCLVDYISNK